jgi:flagellar FliJ protein
MSTTLQTLLEHAEHQRDAALADLLQAEALARRHLAMAEQLQAYRADYCRRHPALGGQSTSIELLRCHQGFMQRLDQAVQQQQAQVQGSDARCTSLRSRLLVKETRVASVRKLLERRGNDARHQAERQEQRRSDEAAQQQHRRREETAGGGAWRVGATTAPAAH